MVINDKSFASVLSSGKILFCGSGITKLQAVISNSNATYSCTVSNASHLAQIALPRFQKKIFADLAYTEPLYVKEFYSPAHKTRVKN
jgi:tRNA threonylcarbamoyladenosine biosynthesis protein TsaB